jgi:hypothetical protein
MRIKDGINFSENFDPSKVLIHDSSYMPSNLYGLLPDFIRKLDIKRFHQSLAKMRDLAGGKNKSPKQVKNKNISG